MDAGLMPDECNKCFEFIECCVCGEKQMTHDTITIPAEIPREIRDGDKVLRVVTFVYGPLKVGELYWDQGNQRFRKSASDLPTSIYLKPITEPVPRYIYPTPVEACQMIAANGGPIECEFTDGDCTSAKYVVKGKCSGVVWLRGAFQFAKCDGLPWKQIRVLQSE